MGQARGAVQLTTTLKFRHGVHPDEHKELTEAVRVRRMPFPDEVVLPLRQHAGNPARVLVKAGDRVERGQLIGLIKFGSRVDLYLPTTYRLLIETGETVHEGKTAMAEAPAAADIDSSEP